MTNEEAANALKCYHYEDGTVPEEIILAIKALEEVDSLRATAEYYESELENEWGIYEEEEDEDSN